MFLGSNSKVAVFNIELPDIEDRLMFIKSRMKQNGYEANISEEQMANLTAGLQLTAIEDIILMGKGKVDGKSTFRISCFSSCRCVYGRD